MYKFVSIIFVLILLSGCCCADLPNMSEQSKTQDRLKVLDAKIETDSYGSKYITGYVQNITDKDMSSNIYIEFNLYDKDKILIGYTNNLISVLKAGGKWKFKCALDPEEAKNATSFEVAKLHGY
jgi:hypothetical protein